MQNTDLLGQALAPIIGEIVAGKMSELDIQGQIKDMLAEVASSAQKIITIKLEGGESKKFPLVHKQFEKLLKCVSIKGINTLLTGGAGLSKSQTVTQVADALGLEFSSMSFSNQTTKTDLIGFVDAMGVYRQSSFVDAFKNGKVFLADEMDACSANVLVLLNSAISNGFVETPDNKVIHAHDNFRFIGTANTNLRGASSGFSARNKLDAASIDRFAIIEWQLDEELEQRITNNDGWLDIVRKARRIAEEKLDGVVITPRSSYDGAKLLRAGFEVDDVIEMTIIKAMGEDARETILKSITERMKSKVAVAKTEAPIKIEKEPVKVEDPIKEVPEVEIIEIKDDEDTEFEW